jgi:hypothetical protein
VGQVFASVSNLSAFVASGSPKAKAVSTQSLPADIMSTRADQRLWSRGWGSERLGLWSLWAGLQSAVTAIRPRPLRPRAPWVGLVRRGRPSFCGPGWNRLAYSDRFASSPPTRQ